MDNPMQDYHGSQPPEGAEWVQLDATTWTRAKPRKPEPIEPPSYIPGRANYPSRPNENSGALQVILAMMILGITWFLHYLWNQQPSPSPPEHQMTQAELNYSAGYAMARSGHYIAIPPSVLRAGLTPEGLQGFAEGAAENRATK